MPLSIDHVGFVGSNLDALAASFDRLGFHVAPAGELAAYETAPDGTAEVFALGQRSRHIIMHEGYIELTQVQATAEAHHLGARGHRDGLHILALGGEDTTAISERLQADGIEVGSVHESARLVEYPDRSGLARFTWFPIAASAAPEAYTAVVHHRTPELVLPPIAPHANAATRLLEVVLAVPDLDEACPRWMDILVAGATEEEDHTWLARPPAGPALRLVDTEWTETTYPGALLPPPPAAVAIRVATSSLPVPETGGAATIEPAGVTAGGVWFRPEDAGGAVLELVLATAERPG